MHRLAVPDPQTLPFAIGTFDSMGPMARADFPHRHTFYEIDVVTRGTGRHIVDLDEYALAAPQLCVLVPGQVHHWRVSRVDGYVILFLAEFLSTYPGDRALLHELAERRLTLRPGDARRLGVLVSELMREYARPAPGTLGVLQAYLHVLLVQAWRLGAGAAAAPPTTRAAVVTAQFTRLLAEPGGHRRTTGQYASRLGLSAGYLSEAVRQAAGHTPAQLIRRAQIVEAKRLLASTPLTVAQVATELGFADPAYFSRFFRRETALSPGEYRRRMTE